MWCGGNTGHRAIENDVVPDDRVGDDLDAFAGVPDDVAFDYIDAFAAAAVDEDPRILPPGVGVVYNIVTDDVAV